MKRHRKQITKRKGFAALALALALLFAALPAASAAEDAPAGLETVRLGYFNFENYMKGAGEGEVKSGFAYDLLVDVAAINGWQYEYVYGDFNELYVQLLSGEIDILPCLVYTEERAKAHLFSDEEIYEECYFISALNEKAAESPTVAMLDGKRLSSVTDTYQNTAFEEWAEANGISMELMLVDSYEESWEQLRNCRADYILNIDNVALSSGCTALFKIGARSAYYAIAPGREDIRQKLNTAVDTIYEINPFAVSHLKEKYLSDTLASYTLSPGELAWLEGRDTIRIAGFANGRPYSYADTDGTVIGVYPDITARIFDRLGIATGIEWKLYSSLSEMRRALKAGEVDLICPDYYSHSFAEENGLIVSEALHTVTMATLTTGSRTPFSDGAVIATPVDKLGMLYMQNIHPDVKLLGFHTVAECVDAVDSGKADAAVARMTALEQVSEKYTKSFSITPLLEGCPVSFSARPEDGMLICIVNRGIHLISDTELQASEWEHTPAGDYSIRSFIRNNKLLMGALLFALLALIAFAVERNQASRKMKSSLEEITRQKEIIEENEKQLIAAKEAANAASRAKTSFLFNMSHDIRTPMNAILGYEVMARKKSTDETVNDYLKKIDIAGNQLLSLVNQVLEMSRIESGRIILQEQKIDMFEGAEVVRTVYADQAKAKGLTFSVEARNITHRYAIGDNDRISQITNNLIGNAIKYTREGGSVTIYAEEEPCEKPGYAIYRLTVEDTGIGISKDYLPHIFEEFTREETSTVSHIQGSGLGMSIVKKMVDLLNGTIEVTSELGVGSKFVVRLPLKTDTDQTEVSVAEGGHEDISLEGMKILLVEDNEMNREIAEEILTDAGAQTDTAEDGVIAVEKVANSVPGRYDIVLMDIQMPRMDGYEATRRIRALENKELASIKILAMTANAFAEDKQHALEAGMDGHLAKPIDIPVLLRVLSHLKK